MHIEEQKKINEKLNIIFGGNDEITIKFRNKFVGITEIPSNYIAPNINLIRPLIHQGLVAGLEPMEILKFVCVRLDDTIQSVDREKFKSLLNKEAGERLPGQRG